MIPFSPAYNAKVANVSTSSQSITIPPVIANTCSNIMIQNNSGQVIFIKTGKDSVTATSNDTPILPGAIMVLNKAQHNVVAVLGEAAGDEVYITIGSGV